MSYLSNSISMSKICQTTQVRPFQTIKVFYHWHFPLVMMWFWLFLIIKIFIGILFSSFKLGFHKTQIWLETHFQALEVQSIFMGNVSIHSLHQLLQTLRMNKPKMYLPIHTPYKNTSDNSPSTIPSLAYQWLIQYMISQSQPQICLARSQQSPDKRALLPPLIQALKSR
jgi:hypothetical protein